MYINIYVLYAYTYVYTYVYIYIYVYTGNGRSHTHIALVVLSPMELRTPSCPKSHTHFERPWNADDFMFKLVKRKV